MQKIQKLINFETLVQEVSEEKVQVEESWPQAGKIDFNQVMLRYRPTTDVVLNNLSFNIAAGEKVGIVGRTAAGKSTIALTLSRILELESGSIEIDGVDISKVGLNRLRSKVTMIPQDPILFKGSLKFNIDPTETIADEVLENMIQKAGLYELLQKDKSCEQKSLLDFEVTEGGENLSSGEKQLISIIRAVLRKAKVVILDEATANIDVLTEQKILKFMNEEMKESTVITIAHRLNTVIKSDKIAVMGHGRLLEFNSPGNLIKNQDSHFSELLQEMKKSD